MEHGTWRGNMMQEKIVERNIMHETWQMGNNAKSFHHIGHRVCAGTYSIDISRAIMKYKTKLHFYNRNTHFTHRLPKKINPAQIVSGELSDIKYM